MTIQNRLKSCCLLLAWLLALVLLVACTADEPAGEATAPAASATASPAPTRTETVPTTAATATATPTAAAEATATTESSAAAATVTVPAGPPTATPFPPLVNGLTAEQFIILPPETQAHVLEIYELGQQMGRNEHYYSKLGDSTTMTPHMLARFDEPNLNLGDFSYLQPTIDHFAGVFDEFGVAARHGLHSWSVFDPFWASEDWCLPEEHVLQCEFRLNNPAFLIIRLGSNDAGTPDGFAYNIRQAVRYALENGVIPIIVTKADRFEGPDNINNIRLREIAAMFQVPLWDFDVVAETLPNRGLDTDGIHLAYYTANDYSDPAAFASGHAVQDLTGLMMLDALLRVIRGEEL